MRSRGGGAVRPAAGPWVEGEPPLECRASGEFVLAVLDGDPHPPSLIRWHPEHRGAGGAGAWEGTYCEEEHRFRAVLRHARVCSPGDSAAPAASPSRARMEEIGFLLRSQDNRATAHPIFVVQQKVRIWGIDSGYTDDFAWLGGDEWVEVDKRLAAALEASYREGRRDFGGYSRVGYIDRWEFVTACLTEAGAEAYIAVNGHNLREPRIYAASAYRNEELQAVREYLMGLPAPGGEEMSDEVMADGGTGADPEGGAA